MRALITGGAGYLGRHLARKLASAGTPVTVLDDLSCANSRLDVAELDHPNIRAVHGSTLDAGLVSTLLGSHRIVVHFASVVGVEETIRQPVETVRNLQGTLNVIERLTDTHVAVFGSSADVYGLHSRVYDREMREDDLQVFEHAGVNRWAYAKVKALEELLFSTSAARVMNIRFFNCYGPYMDQPYPKRVVPQFVGQVLRHEPLRVSGDGTQTRTLCYFQDLVDGVAAAIDWLAGQRGRVDATINLGGTETLTVLEIADAVQRAAIELGLIEQPLPVETGAQMYSRPFDDGWHRVPDIRRARELFGYEPRVPLAEGLRRTLAIHHRSAVHESR
ncbi:MAG TPA: NAD-dependent epimerase/dehydratase family protein [Candidatus Polarisedimenticolaceae bacterium]|nr:NAD-dependent epimerase/dehydratase family protein [Candidatus Polarisedimenticolaceae bacterium]